jgi:hypothetical protein
MAHFLIFLYGLFENGLNLYASIDNYLEGPISPTFAPPGLVVAHTPLYYSLLVLNNIATSFCTWSVLVSCIGCSSTHVLDSLYKLLTLALLYYRRWIIDRRWNDNVLTVTNSLLIGHTKSHNSVYYVSTCSVQP